MKKFSYCEMTNALIIIEYIILVVAVIVAVVGFTGNTQLEDNAKILLIIGASIVLVVLLSAVIIVNHRLTFYYRVMCRKFAKGETYREFIDNIGTMAPELSEAIERLDGLLDRQEVIQLSTKQAEFLALQNQINPHFLYNTLDAIRGDALCVGADNIADITEALSTFFRYTITDAGSLVTLETELDNVENYFKIQKYRFDDRLSLSVKLNDDKERLMRMRCPKLTVQPIVENAIFHGLETQSGQGAIQIEAEIIDQKLHIDISDNGKGMDEKKLLQLNEQLRRISVGYIVEEQKKKKGGIALKNVCRRIKLLFGEEYGIHISSIVGVGTKVEISLPVVLKDKAS